MIVVQEELPVSPADRAAGVLRQAWAKLGGRDCRLEWPRVVWVQTPKEVLQLVTNLEPAELSAAEVALLYRQRWQIELFFRWIKCILGCRHWLAESPEGVAIQVYLALIAALLLQLYTGQRPNRRMMELIQFYLLWSGDLGKNSGRAWSGNAEPWRLAKILKISRRDFCAQNPVRAQPCPKPFPHPGSHALGPIRQ